MTDKETNRSGIYQIVNTTNGKIYVGSAVNVSARWYEHRRTLRKGIHHNQHLQRAWDKYGEAVFDFVVVETVAMVEDLVPREQFWLDETKAAEIGYNISPTAESQLGCRRSPEARARMKEAAKNKPPMSEETKAKISAASKGHTLSAEVRAVISEKAKGNKSFSGRTHTDETKSKISVANKGRKRTPEFSVKMSQLHKGKVVSDETRARMSAGHKGLKASPETRAKIGDANRRRKGIALSQERRARMSVEQTGRKHSEETKQKIRESALGRKQSAETKRKISDTRKERYGVQKSLVLLIWPTDEKLLVA